MNARQEYINSVCKRIGVDRLSFRACKFIEQNDIETKESLRALLLKEFRFLQKNNFGMKTYNELRAAIGMAVPAKQYLTMRDKVKIAEDRVRELQEKIIALEAEIERMKPVSYESL